MGLREDSATWGCFKCEQGGKTPGFLIKALLGCSWNEANKHFTDQDWHSGDLGDLRRKLDNLGVSKEPDRTLRPWRVPRELQPLTPEHGRADVFYDYLNRRGLPDESAERYGLRVATSGEFRWRLCFPFMVGGAVVGMTGRHVGDDKQRYHTQPANVTSQTVYNYDNAAELGHGDALVLVEGPVDTVVLDWHFYKQELPSSAIGMAGLVRGSGKFLAIVELSKQYDRTLVLFDPKAESRALSMAEELRTAGACASARRVFDGRDDPGEYSAADAARLVS